MKYIPIFLLFVVFASLTSCSNNDESIAPSDAEIVGKWNLVSLKSVGTFSTGDGDLSISLSNIGEATNINSTYDFLDNGNVNVSGSMDYLYTYDLDGTEFSYTITNFAFIVSGKWQRNGDLMIFAGADGVGMQYNIVELTNNTMTLSAERTVTQDMGGMNGTTVETTTIVLSR